MNVPTINGKPAAWKNISGFILSNCNISVYSFITSGVREYRIVDPEKNRILVYNFESEDAEDYTFTDSIKAGIYDDLYINFSEITGLLNM